MTIEQVKQLRVGDVLTGFKSYPTRGVIKITPGEVSFEPSFGFSRRIDGGSWSDITLTSARGPLVPGCPIRDGADAAMLQLGDQVQHRGDSGIVVAAGVNHRTIQWTYADLGPKFDHQCPLSGPTAWSWGNNLPTFVSRPYVPETPLTPYGEALLRAYKDKSESLERKCQDLKKAVGDTAAECQELRAQNEHLRKTNEEQAATRAALEHQIKVVQNDVWRRGAEVSQLQRKVEELESSGSIASRLSMQGKQMGKEIVDLKWKLAAAGDSCADAAVGRANDLHAKLTKIAAAL